MESHNLIGKYSHFITPVLIFITPLLFIPLSPNIFTTPKQFLLVMCAAVLMGIAGYIASVKKQYITPSASITVPVTLIILAFLLNSIVSPEGWVEAATGRTSLYIACAILAFGAALSSSTLKTIRMAVYAFITTSCVLAVVGLLQLLVIHKIPGMPGFMSDKAFTPSGSPLVTATMLAIGAVAVYVEASRSTKGTRQYSLLGLGIFLTIAAVAYISLLLPGGQLAPALLSYDAAWSVSLDALKSTKNLLMGVGIANYTSLYTAVKPLSVNATGLWNAYPLNSSSEILHLLATTGIVGLGSILIFVGSTMAKIKTAFKSYPSLAVIFVGSFIALVLTPASVPILVVFFLSAGLLHSGSTKTIEIPALTAGVITGVCAVIALFTSFFAVRAYQAESHVFRAQKALAANDGKTVYEQSLAAVKLFPQVSSYRMSNAQINVSLAAALSQKNDLTEAEREQVATLVSQAIREAKAVVEIRPNDARGWQNLGSLYRNLINVAEGADQFAVSSYAQAVKLDPANPELRVELGGLLYQISTAQQDEDQKTQVLARAVQEFQMAVQLKPDYANGYYNLSKALETAGNIQGAHAAMQKSLASLDPTSPDVAKATTDLESLKAKLPKASPTPSPSGSPAPSPASDLSQPSPFPSPLDGGPIRLPDSTPSSNE